ncbi:MAG: exopolysaccharide biosynthesis polyprenyl glycosylphosphotransferase [bacterium]
MLVLNKKEPWLLFLGDIVIFVLSLWLTLGLRYLALPSLDLFADHLVPYAALFLLWALAFFIAGLYEKHTVMMNYKLPGLIFRTQVINSVLAIIFFYFIPYFGITPKTILFIYLVVSFLLFFIWRMYGQRIFGLKVREPAILVGSGEEMHLLLDEVNNNPRYNFQFISHIDLDKIAGFDLQKDVIEKIYSEGVSVVAIDLQHEKIGPMLPHLYNLLFSKIQFVDIHKVYEDIFDRVPLSLIKYNWFLENISLAPSMTSDILKRLIDLVISVFFGLISLIVYPFVYLAIKIEDGGSLFIIQNRIGRNNLPVKILKFRTMSFNDNGEDGGKKGNQITRVGSFLRKSRIDELPQLWNVIKGDLSLIGPRPELPDLAKKYEQQIPYYNVRHLIKPGLSGWAQLYHENHPHHDANVEETKNKLSYDLYYVKNRSFGLDLEIALKTIKTLLSRSGK